MQSVEIRNQCGEELVMGALSIREPADVEVAHSEPLGTIARQADGNLLIGAHDLPFTTEVGFGCVLAPRQALRRMYRLRFTDPNCWPTVVIARIDWRTRSGEYESLGVPVPLNGARGH